MKSTTTIERDSRTKAEGDARLLHASSKLVGPVSATCAARTEIAQIQYQEETLAADPSLANYAAALASHNFRRVLFVFGLLILLAGECFFIMPALIEAVGASGGAFGGTLVFRVGGGAVLLAAITMGVLVLKLTLPPLSSSLRDAFDVEIANPGNAEEVEAAFQRRLIARRHSTVNAIAIALYLVAVGWIMSHNLSAGRLFLDRLEALDAARLRAAAPVSPGDALFEEASAAPAGEPAPTHPTVTRKNPQSAVLGLLLILHGALLIIPLDFRAAEQAQQALASRGVSGTSASLLRRRLRVQRRLFKKASNVAKILARFGTTPESQKLLRAKMEEIAGQFESSMPAASGSPGAVAVRDAAWVEVDVEAVSESRPNAA